MTKRSSILLYIITLILLVIWAFLPNSWDTHRPYIEGQMVLYDTITILAPVVSKILLWTSVLIAACLFILSLLAYKWSVIRFPPIALMLAVVAFPCAGFAHTFFNLAPWEIYGQVNSSNGKTYVFCDSSFLQGQIMALAIVEKNNFLFKRMKVLVTNNGDSPRSWASVIRPGNPQDTYGQLYLNDQQMLIGIRSENKCYLAYDLSSGKLYGHGEIEGVSPFICLGKNDELNLDDIDIIRERIINQEPGSVGYPHLDSLKAGITHPNPKVKDVAEELLALISERQSHSESR